MKTLSTSTSYGSVAECAILTLEPIALFFSISRSQSVEAQVKHLRDAGAEKIFRETASGATTERRALARAISSLGKGDTLLVTRLDRLARSTRDILNTPRPDHPVTSQTKRSTNGASIDIRMAKAALDTKSQPNTNAGHRANVRFHGVFIDFALSAALRRAAPNTPCIATASPSVKVVESIGICFPSLQRLHNIRHFQSRLVIPAAIADVVRMPQSNRPTTL